ncbi:MAG TPA: glycoside hydrolase family 32 protein [Pirellulales bacterium]|jgi:fructan beta-fructosidase
MRFLQIVLLLLASCNLARAEDRPDIVLADFEGDDYGVWRSEGEAFGTAPARGTLPNQMAVSGFLGQGLVNSFRGGDATQGTLTSPPFAVERRYINLLVGGGHHPTETSVDLVVDGRVVESATGPAAGGGNEHLDWQSWDVQDLAGKQAVIRIVDRNTGGWGHVLVDQIVQSDRRLAAEPASRDMPVTAHYLNLPVRTGAPPRHVRFTVDGRTVREFDIELADAITSTTKSVAAPLKMQPKIPPGAISLWGPTDVSVFRGKTLRIEVDALPKGSQALELATIDDEPRVLAPIYHEKQRPQFHFTAPRGWLNDPNGLVYSAGEWHLFYQHNPYGWNWGNMHWGHAVSDDLVSWRELPIALSPRRYGDWCFSGSAVIDHDNTSGFKKGDGDLLVLAYTSTGRGECIAFSNDAGRTWTEFDGNPVVKHQGRDPRLVWHAPTKRWVMAIYDETDSKRWIAFYTSSDLKIWEFASRIEGFFECPDLFEIASDDDETVARWVLYGADGKYVLGQFDGRVFTPDTEKQQLWHGNFYAAQTFSDAPDNRRVQIGWGQGITFPGMPFNQQMTVPVELTLRSTSAGPRLFAWPVDELESLRSTLHAFGDVRVSPDENPLEDITGELFDIEAEIDLGDVHECGFTVRGVPVTYNVERHELSCGAHKAPLLPADNVIRVRLLADRGSIEIFGNSGEMALSSAAAPAAENRTLAFFTRGGRARLRSVTVYELRSAW